MENHGELYQSKVQITSLVWKWNNAFIIKGFHNNSKASMIRMIQIFWDLFGIVQDILADLA